MSGSHTPPKPSADGTSAEQPAPPRSGRVLRVATRGSPLALTQTRALIAQLARAFPELGHEGHGIELVVIKTTGDAVQDRRLAEIGGKGLFAKEIHEAVQEGRADLAVHSLKDLETTLPDNIVLACTPEREDARDALILPLTAAPRGQGLEMIAQGGVVGTASVRRQAQLMHARPDLSMALLRGNVQTRLDRTEAGEFAASILAAAGLRRLGIRGRAAALLPIEVMLPAACQGIVGVTARGDDDELLTYLSTIEHRQTRAAAEAERAFLAALDGSCRTPAGAFAEISGSTMRLRGLVARPDGSFLLRRDVVGPASAAAAMGAALGEALRRDSPADIFA